MKFKRCISAISSSALVLGLSFLLYPQTTDVTVTDVTPTATVAPTLTPDPELLTDSTATPSPETVSPTSAPEPSYQVLLNIGLSKPLPAVSELVTSYIQAYYANDFETTSSLVTDATLLSPTLMENNSKNVKRVENIELYSKPGIDGVFSIVYATYSLYYNDILISVPQFSEYYVKRLPDGTFRIQTIPLSSKTMTAFSEVRQTEEVLNLSVLSLIRRYHNACLAVNEPLLKQCVTDSEYLNLDYIASRYSVTESFSDYDLLLYPGVNEFEYIAFVTHNEKIVFSQTPAPCMESYYIDLDPVTGIPAVYLGITSLDTDAYCAAVIQSDEIQELAKQTNEKMQEALLSDDDLKDFYQLLVSNSSGN